MAIPRYKSARERGFAKGYRSGLEERIAKELAAAQVPVLYETDKITYVDPAKTRTYTPDFKLPSGIYVETKGRFLAEDRRKHLLVKEQHPHIEIRFVFSNSRTPITKGSKTTYAMWCEKNGFKYADKHIPMDWLMETKTTTSEDTMPEKTMGQNIRKHLEMAGDITAFVATKEYGTVDLRDQIYFLRKTLKHENTLNRASEDTKVWIKTSYHKSPVNNERYSKYTLMKGNKPYVQR